jgi:predicted nuclease of restriction endonuclease-like (RecB) superfamily
MTELIDKSYIGILSSLKIRIRSAQIKASISVNTQMIQLYWEIGRVISMEQKRYKWGSKVVLVHQIESSLYQRQAIGTKVTNFKETLPAPQSELAEQMIKDSYKLDFLSIYDLVKEMDLENELEGSSAFFAKACRERVKR